ncbi:hypothetical protein L226DRAFT_502116 [Lentinus tigrinus ALCF2SS1-7]|uniref:F-box domain-containing protein n=1 Tax=Lentinus tigrinus ALCF2SS1-6 TaxID=1328759 RepID=A0A5C2RZY9_9APHY|nr:hypothetical protein L227DRAFT_553488 [Lentinus tigrinus ALCF2SS1-6]RPD79507.1 hypothetical protein L226DRAFT_502116 [Lentinus tigrinus ALCF2SS1-7]
MLLSLPADVSLQVLAYLSLNELSQTRRAARAIDQFFHAHEDSIYHQAAIYHRFVRPQTALADVVLADGWLEGVRDWKELCRRRTVLEKNWDGHGYVHEGGYQPGDDTVINFVIDEQQRTAISLSRKGGLVVRALEDNRLLWALSKEYVGMNRFDFSEGFLVFKAKQSGLEIWRRVVDVKPDAPGIFSRGRLVTTPLQHPSPSAVRDFQLQAAALAPVDKQTTRGQFLPHAYIDTSDVGAVRLFGINFPLLAYAPFTNSSKVTVIDAGSGESLWNVDPGDGRLLGMPPRFIFPDATDRVPMDFDISKEHICLCMYTFLVLIRLPKHFTSDFPHAGPNEAENPPDMLVLGEMDSPAARQTNACLLTPVVEDNDAMTWSSTDDSSPVVTTLSGRGAFERFQVTPPSEAAQKANMHALVPLNSPRMRAGFVSARFSPDGRHLVAATAFGLLYFAWDFARVEGGMMFSDITEHLFLEEPVREVSWDSHLRRLAVRTAWEDVFIVTLNPNYHAFHADQPEAGPVESPCVLRGASVMRLRDFSNHDQVGWARGRITFNGMHMTRTALWLVWDVGLLAYAVAKREHAAQGQGRREQNANGTGTGSICFLDFTYGL